MATSSVAPGLWKPREGIKGPVGWGYSSASPSFVFIVLVEADG